MASAAVAPLVPIIGPMDAIIIAAYLGSAAGSASQGDYLGAVRKMVEGPGQIMFAHSLAHMMTVEIMASRACFPAGTLVATADGRKPIERIESSDRVWAFDFGRSEWRLCDVLETYQIQHNGDVVEVQLGEEVIQSTDGHPFWVVHGEGLAQRPEMTHCPTYEYQSEVPGRWVYAKDLRVGDVLLLHNGERVAVDGLTIHHEEVPVYNFAVAELHSYAVGCSEVLVHNDNGSWSAARSRFWRNIGEAELANPSGRYSPRNIDRMLDGLAPRIRVLMRRRGTNGPIVTRDISMEIHHWFLPRRGGSPKANQPWNLEIVTPWAHEGMDECRHVGWDLIKILVGTNGW